MIKKIAWAKPSIGIDEKKAIEKVFDSGWFTQGPITETLEKKIAQMIGCKHAIVTNNGTSSLICSLLSHNIGSGDEVIVPSFTFNVLSHPKCLENYFLDFIQSCT